MWEGIEKFAWDQEGNIVDIYVTMEGVESLPKENVRVMIDDWSVEARVVGLGGKEKKHLFRIEKLFARIIPEQSVRPSPRPDEWRSHWGFPRSVRKQGKAEGDSTRIGGTLAGKGND